MGSMDSVARQKKVLELVRRTENISVSALVDGLEASAATVRRDLVQLEEAGKVLRILGCDDDRVVGSRGETLGHRAGPDRDSGG